MKYQPSLYRVPIWIILLTVGGICLAQPDPKWKINDMRRPLPAMVTPGTPSTQESPGRAPSDAIVLFDGTGLDAWTNNGQPAGWKVESGYMEVTPGGGSIETRQSFGDCQLHVEWAAPHPPKGSGQGCGNSGVYLMKTYEIQVLDSHGNETYSDGQAASLYAQYPPLVNSSLPSGQWQTYDIVFRRPRFDADGNLLTPAIVTLFHNGVLAQDHAELTGPTAWMNRPKYQAHPDQLPLLLQNHGDAVRFRNIWIRELEPYAEKERAIQVPVEKAIEMSEEALGRYAGKYELSPTSFYRVEKEDGHLVFFMGDSPLTAMYPASATEFFSKALDARFEFTLGPDGAPEGIAFIAGGGTHRAKRSTGK